MQKRPHMRAPPPVRSSSSTAPCRTGRPSGADGRDCHQRPSCGLARRRSWARLRPADRPSRTVAGRAACAVKGRRSWSPERRISTLISLLRRAVAQGVQMRGQKSRAGGAAAAQSAASSIDVRNMLSDQRVYKCELWVAGAGVANRCERSGEG